MRKEWLGTSDLVGKFGLPTTLWGLIKKAKNEKWKSRKRSGKGGGNEYHIDSLPADVQKNLRISEAKKSASFKKGQATAQDLLEQENAAKAKRLDDDERHRALVALRGKAGDRVAAKAYILGCLNRFQRVSRMPGRKGVEAFTEACNNGQIELPENVTSVVKKVTVATLYNWLKKERESGTASLAGSYGKHRKG